MVCKQNGLGATSAGSWYYVYSVYNPTESVFRQWAIRDGWIHVWWVHWDVEAGCNGWAAQCM